jgi:hypothetical protein
MHPHLSLFRCRTAPRLRLGAHAIAVAAALAAASALFGEPGRRFDPIPEAAAARLAAAVPSRARATPAQPRRLLVFYRTEGFVHTSIPCGNEALRAMGGKTGAFTAVVSDDMAMFEPDALEQFDAVVFNNTTQLRFDNPAHRAALLAFLAKGRGMAGLHAGSDNFPTWPEAQELLGGVFHSHPWNAGDVVAVKLDEPAHPLAAAFGGRGFWIREEIYQIAGPYGRDKQRVVASLDMSKPANARPAAAIIRTDGDFPVSWIKRTAGGGRVFYTSLGHREDVYFQPEVLQHYLDGLQFALGDLAMDAVPSASLAVAPEAALAPDFPLPLQDRGSIETVRAALAALRAWDFGADRCAVVVVEDCVRRLGAAAAAAEIEAPLMALLADPGAAPGAKDLAGRLLAHVATPKSVGALQTLLGDAAAAEPAARILFAIPGAEAEAALAAALPPARGALRLALVEMLGRRRVAAAVPELARMAASPDPAEAGPALIALGQIASEDAWRALAVVEPPAEAKTTAAWARIEAAQRLAAAGKAAQAGPVLRRTIEPGQPVPVRTAAARALLAAEGMGAWPSVAPLLADPDLEMRSNAAALLGEVSDPAAVARAVEAMPLAGPEVRAILVAGIARHPGPAAHEALVHALADAGESVRLAAIDALGRIGGETAIDPLLALGVGKGRIAAAARDALAAIPGAAVDQRLLGALAGASADAKPVVLEALGRRLCKPAYTSALAATRDPSEEVRRAAFAAVGMLAGREDLPTLLCLLGTAADPAEIAFIRRALSTAVATTADVEGAAAQLADRIEALPQDKRAILVALLATLDTPRSLVVLEAELASPDAERRRAVLRSVGNARLFSIRPTLFACAAGAAEPAERVLALRALLDLLRANPPWAYESIIADYGQIAKMAERPEEKAAALAALRRWQWFKSAQALLVEFGEPAFIDP